MIKYKQAVGGQPPRYAPAPLFPRGRQSALRRRADGSVAAVSHSQYDVPMHTMHCSRLTRQHGHEQSGLLTLTVDPLTLKVVSESRVMWATSVPILVFLGLSVLDLGPMYATDRHTDVRQHRLMPPPIRGGGIIICDAGRHNMPPPRATLTFRP